MVGMIMGHLYVIAILLCFRDLDFRFRFFFLCIEANGHEPYF